MLVKNTENLSGKVVVIRLATGELILSKYVSEDSKYLNLEKSFSLMINEKTTQVLDFCYGADDKETVKLNIDAVITVAVATKELSGEYQRLTSNLIVPAKPSIQI